MPLKSLNIFLPYRNLVVRARNWWFSAVHGVRIHPSSQVSLSARIISGSPGSIVIDSQTLVAFKVLIYSTDFETGRVLPVNIGSRCFIGGGAIITPGTQIGDGCIIGAGSVVSGIVPAHTIAVGNPAGVLRSDVEVGPMGRLPIADANTRLMYGPD